MSRNKFFKNFTEWEYWSSFMFYAPNIPYAVYLALKAGNFTFFTATNPGIKSSGNGTESKFQTLKLIPEELKPKSIFVPVERKVEEVLNQVHNIGIEYPLIAKPDVGFRGVFVKKIYNEEQLIQYIEKHPFDLIVQDFIDLPYECGVFYQKLPHHEKGIISSLTLKSFMSVEGDGIYSISKLIHLDARAKHYVEKLKEINLPIWDTIPENGKIIILSEIGNHGRGTQFINGNEFINASLESIFNGLSKKIPGFFYGRFDIKYNSLEELKEGKNYKFLEVNGIISEPTHMYDAHKGTYFEALKTIRNHWKSIFLIATNNHKNGTAYMKMTAFWSEISDLMKYVKTIKKLSKTKE